MNTTIGSRAAPTAARVSPESARVVGVDLARMIAIVGMMCDHVWPPDLTTRYAPHGWVNGPPSTLFAVLGGISVVLSTRRYLDRGDARAARWATLTRGVVVVVLGLTLSTVSIWLGGTGAIPVLTFFGVAICCTVPLLTAPRWVLAVTAVVLALSTAAINAAVRSSLGQPQESGVSGGIAWQDLLHPLVGLRAVFSSGTYPVSTWLVYLLIGMIVGRTLLAARASGHEPAYAGFLAVSGAVAAAGSVGVSVIVYNTVGRAALLSAQPQLATVAASIPGLSVDSIFRLPGYGAPPQASWPELLLDNPHTGTLLDITRTTGVSLLVLGLCLGLAHLPAPVLKPVRATGAVPLTVYTVHVLALELLSDLAHGQHRWYSAGPSGWAVQVGIALALGAVLAVLGRRGPLETLTSACARRVAALRPASSMGTA